MRVLIAASEDPANIAAIFRQQYNVTGKNIYRIQWRWASNGQILQSKGYGAPILQEAYFVREKR